MSAGFKMGNELRFQERWEFRRRDEDANSSSDDSKSSLSGKPVFKKHKLVSNLVLVGNDETSDTPELPQKESNEHGTCGPVKSRKAKKKQTGTSKKGNFVKEEVKRDPKRKVSRKKCKSGGHDPASLDSVKTFMESILKELEVTRENLFFWMRDEMHKLMEDTTTMQPTRREHMNERQIVQVQHHNFLESDIADGTSQKPRRRESSYEREIVQVQHQDNYKSGLKLLADHTTQQQTMGEGCDGQETVQVLQQDNFKSGTKLMIEDTNQQPTRRKGRYGLETIQVQHQANIELGTKLMTGDTTGQPTKRKGRYDRQTVQVQDQNNFNLDAKSIVDDKNQKPIGREGSYAQEDIQVHHQNNVGSELKAKNCNGGSLGKAFEGQRVVDSNYPYRVSENQVEHVQHSGPMTSTEKAKNDTHDLFVKPNFSSNYSDQVPSSMYLTLPSVIPEPWVASHRISSSACNYIHPGISGNKAAVNIERVNLMLGASQRGYLMGMQKEQLGSTAQVGARNVSCFDQNSATTSGIGPGFPVPLHHGLDRHFSIPSRVGIENQSQENNNILAQKMNGGALTFSGGNHTLSGDYVTNNFHSNLSYKADGRLMAYQTQNLKGGHLFPS